MYCRTTSASTAPHTPRRKCGPYASVLLQCSVITGGGVERTLATRSVAASSQVSSTTRVLFKRESTPTGCTTTLSSKVNLHHAINFGVLCGANLATSPHKIEGDETRVAHHVEWITLLRVVQLVFPIRSVQVLFICKEGIVFKEGIISTVSFERKASGLICKRKSVLTCF